MRQMLGYQNRFVLSCGKSTRTAPTNDFIWLEVCNLLPETFSGNLLRLDIRLFDDLCVTVLVGLGMREGRRQRRTKTEKDEDREALIKPTHLLMRSLGLAFPLSSSVMSRLMASKTGKNCLSWRCSRTSILGAGSRLESIRRRKCTNVRLMAMLASTARGERSTLESTATPCSTEGA